MMGMLVFSLIDCRSWMMEECIDDRAAHRWAGQGELDKIQK